MVQCTPFQPPWGWLAYLGERRAIQDANFRVIETNRIPPSLRQPSFHPASPHYLHLPRSSVLVYPRHLPYLCCLHHAQALEKHFCFLPQARSFFPLWVDLNGDAMGFMLGLLTKPRLFPWSSSAVSIFSAWRSYAPGSKVVNGDLYSLSTCASDPVVCLFSHPGPPPSPAGQTVMNQAGRCATTCYIQRRVEKPPPSFGPV